MIQPNRLKKGDTIGLLAPSGCVTGDQVRLSVSALERFGLSVAVGKSCYAKHGYLAGTDRARAADLNAMFQDQRIRGIFSVRGGYGAQRLLDLLDYDAIRQNPKVFAGYSDATALHIALNQRCGLVTYHAPMAATELLQEDLDDYTVQCFSRLLFSDEPIGRIPNPPGETMRTLAPGTVEGAITGGNLSIVATSIGTAYEIDTRRKILFLEEVGEEPYRVDRMLLQLKHAGKFNDCAGVLLGAFMGCIPKSLSHSLTLLQIFKEILLPLNKPVVYNFRCGHCLPTATIPMGNNAILDADKKLLIIVPN